MQAVNIDQQRLALPPPVLVTADELDCFRLTAPLLAKACGMELRSQLHSEEASARAALARQLLRDAQRPLSTLNTFGAMLTPRLEDGDIDKDMAEGIMLQVGSCVGICAEQCMDW